MNYKIFSRNFLVASCAFFSLNSYAQSAAPDIQKIQARGKLIVAVCKQDYPPFFFHGKDGQLEGYDIELAKEIAKEIGVKVEFENNATSFDNVPYEVSTDVADIAIGALTSTTQRGLQVGLTAPYLKINKVLLVNRVVQLKLESDASYSKSHAIKFGALKNSSFESLLKEKYFLISKYAALENIVTYNTPEDAMKDVTSGKIYAFFTDDINANYLTRSSHSTGIFSKKIILSGQIDPISIAVNFKNPTLLNWLNLMIENMSYNGTQIIFAQKHLKGYN